MSNVLTPSQERLLDLFKNSTFVTTNFYFSGGTALSEYYLQHRYSEELDFFSQNKFSSSEILAVMQSVSAKLGSAFDAFNIEDTYIYNIRLNDGGVLKVDFSYYPYTPIDRFIMDGSLPISSKKDVAVNKTLVISQRTDVKDFVDLFFLLQDYSIFDLHQLANKKFRRDYDLMLLASDFLKVKKFENLPKMIKPLTLDELKMFFVDLATKLGLEVTTE